ncbi:hypothetical protein [Streptomyces sp. HM190]|uniref:hypothetical protein n=1 Tax=Streptomyces sp. HM190 TaxID=2695266 RepID=UPI00135B7A96|nr:hypothetical protein [Streptomyces sp. HM190]
MSIALRRTAGIAGVVGGIGLAAWLVFGALRDGEGGVRLLRHGSALVSLGAIYGGAWLTFSGGEDEETSDTVAAG